MIGKIALRLICLLLVMSLVAPAAAQDDGGLLNRIVKLADAGWQSLVGASDLFSFENIAAAQAVLKAASLGDFSDIFTLRTASALQDLFSDENLEAVSQLYEPEQIEGARQIISMINSAGPDGSLNLDELSALVLPTLTETVIAEAHDAVQIKELACTPTHTYFELLVDGGKLRGTVDITIGARGDAVIRNILPLPAPKSLVKLLAFDVAPVVGFGAIKLGSHVFPPVSLALTAGETVVKASAKIYDWMQEQKALGRETLAPFTLRAGPLMPPIAMLIQAKHSPGEGNDLTYSADYSLAYHAETTAPQLDVAERPICVLRAIEAAAEAGGVAESEAADAASQANIVVGGECTLADAIHAANADRSFGGCPAGDGADVIALTGDITLTAELPAIGSEITIEGGGHTISGAEKFRIFFVEEGGDFTIQDMTLTKGNPEDAQPQPGGGGAIYNRGNLAVLRSTLSQNAARYGGALVSIGVSNILESNFSNNVANSRGYHGSNGYGGAIVSSQRMTITESSFRANSTNSSAGAIYFSGREAILSINDCDFIENRAPKLGGALRVDSKSKATVNNSYFYQNRAEKGSAIYVPSDATLSQSGNTFSSNIGGRACDGPGC